ncbi:hypothetical protein F5878DRAFT_667937 [Lentinula raphanica]|uniref:Uncharacterized protein n=1 Tax=Lentinula raphanica TaxID=153919 RepID=A0AA38U2A4_9AGAR|nr:hypothetical protein F5878DRAFT_667937 [Lentinula raphanica]
MPSTAPTYNENPTFAGSIPPGFTGTRYGEALVGLRLAFDQYNRTGYLKDLGKCMNPRTPGKVHDYTVLTGGQRANQAEMGPRRFCGTKDCCNPDDVWGPPRDYQHIPVPVCDRRELADQYAFWLESMGRDTQAKNIQNHFLEDADVPQEADSSSAGRQIPHDPRKILSSPIRPQKRKPVTQRSIPSKRTKFSQANSKDSRSEYDDSESEVEIVDVKYVGNGSLSTHSTTSFASASPSRIGRPSGHYTSGPSAKDCVFTCEELIVACKRLEEKVTEVVVDKDLKAAIRSLKEMMDIFV